MYKKINYAIGDVASTTAIGATTLTLKAGHTITTDIGETNKFVAVFYDGTKSSPYQDTNREIVEAYRTNTNDFVIARAKEGTSAKQWIENDKFMLIASAGVFNEYETEIASKQDALGYTAENAANKKTSLTDNSDTYYPTQKAVKTALDAKEPILTKGNLSGSGVITIDNTRQVIGGAATISHTDSATVRHVTDTEKATWNAKQNALGYTPENIANKKTSITDSDTDYLTSKAVKTAVDAKAPIASPTLTGTVTLPKAVNIKDTSADHEYQLGVSELAANRTVTLPSLTGNDTFMFKDFHKASSAEINTGTEDNKYITPDGLAGSNIGTRMIQVKVCDDATALTTGDGKIIFMIPEEMNGMNLVKAHAMVSTVSSSGTPTIQIRNVTDGVDMLSTKITIDASEYTSYTAATAPVIDTSKDDVATGDRIAIDVDSAGSGAKGLTIFLAFRLPW